jgi:hypothetical protein
MSIAGRVSRDSASLQGCHVPNEHMSLLWSEEEFIKPLSINMSLLWSEDKLVRNIKIFGLLHLGILAKKIRSYRNLSRDIQ